MKRLKLCLIVFVAIVVFGCGAKKDNFIVTENGKKQYKNEDGILVKNDWVEVNGDKYYFDLNGYMVTNDWIQNEYYVDKEGKMKTDYWYNDEKNPEIYYYLGKDGKYVKNDIVEIGKKKYAFDKSGKWIKNKTYEVEKPDKYVIIDANGIVIEKEGICEVDGKQYYVKEDGYIVIDDWQDVDKKKAYFDGEGKRVYMGFGIYKDTLSTESEIKKWCYIDENGDILKDDYVKVGDLYYCANKDGVLLQNEWDEHEGKKYYYGSDCYMLKNQFIDNTYYVNENGEMIINKEIVINGKKYYLGLDGKIVINSKVTTNAKKEKIWEINSYIDTGKKYISNIDLAVGIGFTRSGTELPRPGLLLVDKDCVRIQLYDGYRKRIKNGEEEKKYFVFIDDDYSKSEMAIMAPDDEYILFSPKCGEKIINCLIKNEKIMILLESYSKEKVSLVFHSGNFSDLYDSLK